LFKRRHNPPVIKYLSDLPNSWFKFVIDCEEDWEEILEYFILPSLIKREQIILMPKGATLEELMSNRLMVAELAVKHNVRYCSREHIVLWNKKVGV
jgi:organic radical activating enzyme